MKLVSAGEDDLAYLLDLETTNHRQGFIGTDDVAVHRRQLADGDCRYLIVEVNDAKAGYVILRGLASRNRCIELKRIAIGEPGRGVGRAVLRAVMAMVFEELKAHRLWLDVYEDNTRARHLYRSLGFVEEGMTRECVKADDRYRSLMVMSMLEGEWRALSG